MSHHCVCHLRWSAQDTIHYNWHVLANCVYLDTYLITSNGRKENHKCDAYVYIYTHESEALEGKGVPFNISHNDIMAFSSSSSGGSRPHGSWLIKTVGRSDGPSDLQAP